MDTKYTILAVDDKIENLKYLNTILNKIYTVRATPNSKMALDSIQYEKPDLILLDIKMPEIDGFELCKTIIPQVVKTTFSKSLFSFQPVTLCLNF